MTREKGFDEIFCRSCGETIKKRAEICPHCGVRNEERDRSNRKSKSRTEESDWFTDIDSPGTVKNGLLALQWGLGILLILAGLGAFISGGSFIDWIISFVQGILFVAIGALLIPPVRERIHVEHSISTFGQVRSVDQEFIQDSSEPCNACYSNITEGVSRTYQEQFVLFGVPLFTLERGENNYCRNCANGEPEINIERVAEP